MYLCVRGIKFASFDVFLLDFEMSRHCGIFVFILLFYFFLVNLLFLRTNLAIVNIK